MYGEYLITWYGSMAKLEHCIAIVPYGRIQNVKTPGVYAMQDLVN